MTLRCIQSVFADTWRRWIILLFDRISYFAAGVYYVEYLHYNKRVCNIIIIIDLVAAAAFECNCSSSFLGRVYGNNMYRIPRRL